MIWRVHARCDAAIHAFAAIGMAGDLQPETVRLINDGFHFLQREGWAIDQRRVRLPHMHGSDKILRRVDLDPVHTVQLRLAYSGAREPWRIDIFVFRESLEKPDGFVVAIVIGSALVDG